MGETEPADVQYFPHLHAFVVSFQQTRLRWLSGFACCQDITTEKETPVSPPCGGQKSVSLQSDYECYPVLSANTF
eukprot:1988677-Amphidinium_carterae.1